MGPESLLLFLSLRQPRRIRVIENVLSGHKTVSNLYWGMRYGVLNYLGALKSIDKNVDHKSLMALIKRGDVTATSDQRAFTLTPQGYQKAVRLRKAWYVPKFLKYNLYYDLKRFKARFILAVQVASEYSYRNRSYYPVQIDYQDAELIKRWFYSYRNQHLPKRCYRFLIAAFKKLDQLDPTLGWQATNLLVGHDNPGQTLSQQSRQLRQPISEMLFRQVDILGALVAMIKRQTGVFTPLLDGLQKSPVSDSAKRTFRLARNHYQFAQISRIQSIRPSTVKEHLLGTAVFVKRTKFPYQEFLSRPLIKRLSQIYRGSPDHWDYSRYQMVTDHDLDFFYFRLFQILRSKQDE